MVQQNIPPFKDFVHMVRKQKSIVPFVGRLLALDPGETTGWSIWDSHDGGTYYELTALGQMASWDKDDNARTPIHLVASNFPKLLKEYDPSHVVYETYRVYDWKSDDHKWSDVPTLRIIGSIETRLLDAQVPYSYQTAQVAKNFVTDDLLKHWGFYQRGQRHSRDSMRHGIYRILFGTSN